MHAINEVPLVAMLYPKAPRSWSTSTLLAAAIIVLLVLCAVLVMVQAAVSRRDDAVQADNKRMTQLLAGYLELNLNEIDKTVQHAAERHYVNTLFGGNLRQDMQNYLQQQLVGSPFLLGIGVANEKGRVDIWVARKGARLNIDTGVALDHYDFFNTYLQEPSADAQLLQLPGRQPGSTQLLFVRRWDKVDSSFGGVIVAVIDQVAIQRFFSTLQLGDQTTLMVLHADGRMLFSSQKRPAALAMLRALIRNTAQPNSERGNVVVVSGDNAQKMLMINATNVLAPESEPEEPESGPEEAHWYEARASAESETLSRQARLDEVMEANKYSTFSFRYLADFPLVVSLVKEENNGSALFSERYLNMAAFPVIFTLFALAIGVLAVKMARQVRYVKNSEKTALLASQAKSDFLAKMSHELRTPLNAIIGFSEMMEAGYFGGLNEKQQERVRDINMCGNHLLELINDILDFSKGEAGKLTLHDEEVNVYELVEKVMRIMEPRARNSHVMLDQDIAERLPFLYVDERKLRQILLNLLTNAVKFTPSGGRVNLHISLDEQHQCVMVIRDTGIGIAVEDIPKAFSVFGQVKKPGHYEGTGLGLPLCKMFVELHGGRIHLESEEGVGTTVTVVLPTDRVLMLAGHRRFLEAA